MAKVDWRGPFYVGQETPRDFQRRGNVGTTLAGAGSYNQRIACDEWRYRSWWGYTYDGPSMSAFPLLDGSISGALRTGNNSFSQWGCHPFGFLMRLQSLPSLDPNTPDAYTSMNTYIAGLNYRFGASFLPSETSDNPECAVFRVTGGNAVQMGAVFFPRVILDVSDSRFLQIEFRLTNSGSDVIIDTRWNEGTEATAPGATGWTTWTNVTTDVSPGVLINEGNWGFGGQIRPTWGGWGGGSNNYIYIDEVRIVTEAM